MTIDKINLNKLKPYSGKTTQSFEHLLYSLMKKEYGSLGNFTAIAGEGGDSGVEFYLDLPGGERWGWQCKCYQDNGRLNQSNRFASIESSLSTACANHPNLTKWFLCLRTNLTVSMVTKTGKPKEGEKYWFDHTLPKKVPANRSLEIGFIGEDEIVRFIGDIKNIGIRSFFFGEFEVNQKWFTDKFNDSFGKVKDKYEPELHTMDDYTQSIIDFKLLNPEYCDLVDSIIKKLDAQVLDAYGQMKSFSRESVQASQNQEFIEKSKLLFSEFEHHQLTAIDTLKDLKQLVQRYEIKSLTNFDLTEQQQLFLGYLKRLDEHVYSGSESIYNSAQATYHSIKQFFEEYARFIRNYISTLESEIHFIAKPAEGKTHICCDIAFKRIQNDLPVIFLTGDKFNHETNLEQTIFKLLDIPANFSFEDLLAAMDVYGGIKKVRIPIIIDGLNETVYNKLFSTIWNTHLPGLISKLKRFQNLAIITTCRLSYKDEIWGNYDRKVFHHLRGFDGYEVSREAIEKYFHRYRIKSDLSFSNLSRFQKPIFLKLYCEIKNPNWKSGEEVDVIIDDDSAGNLFETYFRQINESVTLNSHILRKKEAFIQVSLEKIAKYLWENNIREIPVEEYYNLIDGTENYNAETSKADILIREGLIITRDTRNNKEYISITYELMSGYLIAKYLIENLEPNEFLPNNSFHQKIKSGTQQHPLYENITDELTLLFPKYNGKMLHDLYSKGDDRKIYSISLNALWKLSPECIRAEDVELICGFFRDQPEHRAHVIDMCLDTITNIAHPFNACFLSSELFKLNVWERDLSWTEFVRNHADELLVYVENFEFECETTFKSPIGIAKLHLAAKYVQWFLVSTHRNLRDYTTRALYYYGRRFPKEFLHLTVSSLQSNDPYLWERTLAALYGVCMASHHKPGFKENVLKMIGESLYMQMFAENAPHYTTHELARDYARGCIRIAQIHHGMLNEQNIERITPPYAIVLPKPKMVKDDGKTTYRPPLDMDFSNYTIGHIVKKGHSYDNPPEKQRVRRQILHRVEQFGWTEERFKSIDDVFLRRHYSRHERPPIERYGKKYSRTAFFEIAGYRSDLGLLSKDFQHYRFSHTDIDPSFPENNKTESILNADVLGDRSISLQDWLKTDDFPAIEACLEPVLYKGQQFVCMDGYHMQNDEGAYRERFTFIRSFIVQQSDYDQLFPLLSKQALGGRWLPEKHDNTDAFAGEYYLFDEATYTNKTSLEFVLSSAKKRVRPGEEGYYPDTKVKISKGKISIVENVPESRMVTFQQKKEFEVLMPVMDYHGPSDNKEINKASSTTVLGKEIAMDLGLTAQAQTFNLFDQHGELAVINIDYHQDSNNMQYMTFLRKDLLNEYLNKNNLKFIWAIWGEREPSLDYRRADNPQRKITDYYEFQKVIEYQE